jgi:hypothetical protein
MTKDDIIRMAKEAADRHGHTFKEHPNDAVLEIIAEAYAMGAAAEQKRCIGIIYGQCGSDNVAQRTVDAIRSQS